MTAIRYRDHNVVPDTFWLVVAALLFAACGLVWLIGQVAAILFGPHQAPAGPAGRHARRPPAPARHLGRPGPGLATRISSRCCPARSACTPPRCSPSGFPPSPMGCWSGCCRHGPAAGASSAGRRWASWWQLRRLLVLGPAAGADHPGPPRPRQRPPPRPPLPGRRAMPLGPGLRATGVVQDPRAGHPGHPGMAGQPGHHLHQT